MSLKGIKYPEKYYYAVKIELKVIKPLDKSHLVYELGIARKSVIGKKLVVEGEKFAWSMIGAHHVDCDAICLHIAQNNHLLYHEVLTENKTGKSIEYLDSFLTPSVVNGKSSITISRWNYALWSLLIALCFCIRWSLATIQIAWKLPRVTFNKNRMNRKQLSLKVIKLIVYLSKSINVSSHIYYILISSCISSNGMN